MAVRAAQTRPPVQLSAAAKHDAPGPAFVEDVDGAERAELIVDHRKGPRAGSLTVAVAKAAMPSRRPTKPSVSVVVALMPSRDGSRCRIAPSFSFIAAICGAIFGASARIVISAWAMTPPFASTNDTACAKK